MFFGGKKFCFFDSSKVVMSEDLPPPSDLDLYYEEQLRLLDSQRQSLSEEKKTMTKMKKKTESKAKVREPKVDANGERIIKSSSKKRKREMEEEDTQIKSPNQKTEAISSSTKNPMAKKIAKSKKEASSFFEQTSLIMHAMGDGPSPLEDAVKKVEADAISYTIKLLQDLRLLSGKSVPRGSSTSTTSSSSSNITIKDFASHIPETTRVYFRWKAMKGLAKTEPVEVPRSGVKTVQTDNNNNDDNAADGDDNDASINNISFTNKDNDEIQNRSNVNYEEDEQQVGEVEGEGESFLHPENAEEQQQLVELEEEATSRLIEDDQGSGNDTALADLSPAIVAFKRRLAFQNLRSRLMTTAQYSRYKEAREASFTNGKGALMKKFSELFPLPRLTKASLDVLAFLAYDRVGTIVEYALRANEAKKNNPSSLSSKQLVMVNSDELLVADYSMLEGQLPLSAYDVAMSSVPSGPLELKEVLDDLRERVNAQKVTQQLKEAREAQYASRKQPVSKNESSNVQGEKRESMDIGQKVQGEEEGQLGHDVEGDEAFLAFLL